jgi:hypothetical protein
MLRPGILPRPFVYRSGYLYWRIGGDRVEVPDEATLERILGRKLPPPHRR